MGKIFVVLLVLLGLAGIARAEYAPTDSYARQTIEGWTVYVGAELRKDEHEALRERVVELLRVKLFDVRRVVPAKALVKLREVPIWVELKDKRFPGMCFHPSADWLRVNGYNPEKAGGVEIGNAENFLKWTLHQPAMVLHELAHAYHHRVLGADHAELEAALRNAREKKLYERVLRYDGTRVRAYGMNNATEYFAESSEAYFGTNDFYPFVRAELEEHDPEMARLVKKLWGVGEVAGK
jgi:hypothetical protein